MRAMYPSTGKNRKVVPVLLGFLVLSVFVAAQELPAAKPESLGLSPERLERIGMAVQRKIDDKRIAGAVTLVVRHGKVAWFKSQGLLKGDVDADALIAKRFVIPLP